MSMTIFNVQFNRASKVSPTILGNCGPVMLESARLVDDDIVAIAQTKTRLFAEKHHDGRSEEHTSELQSH